MKHSFIDSLIVTNPNNRTLLNTIKHSILSGEVQASKLNQPLKEKQVEELLRNDIAHSHRDIILALNDRDVNKLARQLTLIGILHCQKQELIRLASLPYDKKDPSHETMLLNVSHL